MKNLYVIYTIGFLFSFLIFNSGSACLYLGMKAPDFVLFARACSPFWQGLLHQSVRLYLALDEPNVQRAQAEDALCVVQGQMVWHLLGDQELTLAHAQEAWNIVNTAQTQLLDCAPEVVATRHACSAAQSLCLVQEPAGGGAWGTGGSPSTWGC